MPLLSHISLFPSNAMQLLHCPQYAPSFITYTFPYPPNIYLNVCPSVHCHICTNSLLQLFNNMEKNLPSYFLFLHIYLLIFLQKEKHPPQFSLIPHNFFSCGNVFGFTATNLSLGLWTKFFFDSINPVKTTLPTTFCHCHISLFYAEITLPYDLIGLDRKICHPLSRITLGYIHIKQLFPPFW